MWLCIAQALQLEVSIAERARTAGEMGVPLGAALSTTCHSGSPTPGDPWSSFVDYVVDKEGSPIVLLKNTAEHTKNLKERRRASMLLGGGIMNPRLTLVGDISEGEDNDFSLAHPYADDLMARPEFKLYKLTPVTVFYVGGFGVEAQWVDVEEFKLAQVDQVALHSMEWQNELNSGRHGSDLKVAVKHFLKIQNPADIKVTAVDRCGVDLRVKSASGEFDEFRVGYRNAPRSIEDAKSELNKLLQEAWETDQGFSWDGGYVKPPLVKKKVV